VSIHFTKEEAIQYLDQVVIMKKDYVESQHNQPDIKAGEVGKVRSVDVWDDVIKVQLDIYGNYYSFSKEDFETHCQILKPMIIAHAKVS